MNQEEAEKIIESLLSGNEFVIEDYPKGEMLVFSFNKFQKKFFIRKSDTISGSYDITEEYESYQPLLVLLIKL